jgi:hypothetical protein
VQVDGAMRSLSDIRRFNQENGGIEERFGDVGEVLPMI